MTATRDRLEQSYLYCREIARRRARNFHYSFILFPKQKSDSLCAVYAFMRYCDDIADSLDLNGNKRMLLEKWRESLHDAMQSRYGDSLILPAFHDTVRRFEIPERYFGELIDGASSDLTPVAYQTFDQLYDYCYRVASVVGLVCIHIFGFDNPEATRHAEFCGVAFQLTNILRDLKEDALMGRVYLPEEDLWAFDYSKQELIDGVYDDRFARLMNFEVLRAKCYYRASLPLLDMIDPVARPGLSAMISIYYSILRKIERSHYDVFGGRTSLSTARKLSIAAGTLVRSRIHGGRPYLRGLQL